MSDLETLADCETPGKHMLARPFHPSESVVFLQVLGLDPAPSFRVHQRRASLQTVDVHGNFPMKRTGRTRAIVANHKFYGSRSELDP